MCVCRYMYALALSRGLLFVPSTASSAQKGQRLDAMRPWLALFSISHKLIAAVKNMQIWTDSTRADVRHPIDLSRRIH